MKDACPCGPGMEEGDWDKYLKLFFSLLCPQKGRERRPLLAVKLQQPGMGDCHLMTP